MPNRVTMAQVAERAGVSVTAVSYVVSGSDRPVSDALRARVEQALVDLDYRPDRSARALRTGTSTPMTGLLVPHVTMPFFAQVADAVQREAGRHGHQVLFANTDFDADTEAQAAARLIAAGVDGLIVLGEGGASAVASACDAARLPVVWVHNDRGLPIGRHVTADHAHAGDLAARHVLAGGASAPLFVGGFTEEETGVTRRDTVELRFDGFRRVAGGHRLVTDLTAAGAYRAVTDVLTSPEGQVRPDALVVGTYGQAEAVVKAVTDAGLTVPGDVAVVAFDGSPLTGYQLFPVTTVRQELDVLASNAFALLNSGGGPQATVHFTLEQGATTHPVPQPAPTGGAR